MGNRCPKCGRTNAEEAFYCAKCKAPLRTPGSKVPPQFSRKTVSPQFPTRRAPLPSSFSSPPPRLPVSRRPLPQLPGRIDSNYRTGLLTPNFMLGERYRIIKRLGKGGMGAVYQAADTRLGDRPVAVKEMSQSRLRRYEVPRAIEDFEREALLLANLLHQNLPHIYDHFSENGRWYLVMDYIEGETLDDYFYQTKGGHLPMEEVLDIGIELCNVLGYLHTRRPPIIFRDLKPRNVMRTPEGHLYLIDFGIARHFKVGQMLDTSQLGTQGYAAPELSSRQTNARSDIYSLGATLHQLLSGNNPTEEPFSFTPLRSYDSSLPPELEKLIMHMLEMEPGKRPPSMAAIKQELQRIAEQRAANTRNAGHGLMQWFRLPFGHSEESEEDVSSLRVEEGEDQGSIYDLPGEGIKIGRNHNNDIYFDDNLISRYHASLIYLENGNYALRDDGSANGTVLNGQKLNPHELYTLKNGDRIQLGQTVLVFNKR